MAGDLATSGRFGLQVADLSEAALERLAGVGGLTTERADLSPPELEDRDATCHDSIFDDLAERGVRCEVSEESLCHPASNLPPPNDRSRDCREHVAEAE